MMKKLRAPYLLILIFCMLALAGCSGGLGRPSDLKVNETDWVLSWSPVENATASTTYIVEIDGREYVSSKTSYSLEGLEEGSYKIRVKATDALGQTGDSKWSDAFVFTKPYENGLVYTLTNANTEYEVTRVGSARGDIEIGDVYRGKPVTSIAEKAFYSSSGVKSIVVGKNVRGNRRLRFHQLLQSPIRDAARRVKRAWRARFSGLPRIAEHKIARQSQRSEKEFFSVLQKHDVRRFGRRYPFCGGVCVFRLRQAFRA